MRCVGPALLCVGAHILSQNISSGAVLLGEGLLGLRQLLAGLLNLLADPLKGC